MGGACVGICISAQAKSLGLTDSAAQMNEPLILTLMSESYELESPVTRVVD